MKHASTVESRKKLNLKVSEDANTHVGELMFLFLTLMDCTMLWASVCHVFIKQKGCVVQIRVNVLV